MNLSEPFIKRPVATLIIIFALVFFGIIAYLYLPVSELPNIDFPTITVTGQLPGADPEMMASNVATPLERQLATVPSIQSMNSVSTFGLTLITLQFSLDRNIDAAAQDITVALSQASPLLPPQMPTPPFLRKVNPAELPVIYLALTAEHMPLSTLDDFAETLISERISMLPDIAEVDIFGSQRYAVRIRVNPNALTQRGLDVDSIANAIPNVHTNLPSGTLQTLGHYQLIKTDGQLFNARQFSEQIIAVNKQASVRLKDIGTVIDSVVNDKVATWLNNHRAIVLAVRRQPGTNTVSVAQNIINLLPILEKQLPGGVHLSVVYNRAEFIKTAIADVQYSLLFAIILVVIVIYLFLNNLRSTIIATLALPVSVIATFAVMYLLNFNLDNLSLMALVLAVGFVIDDAVVVLENIYRYIEKGQKPYEAALNGTAEVGFTVLSMTFSLVAVFIPILFIGGLIGRLFHEFAIVVSAAILFSAFVSLSFTPMLASRFLKSGSIEENKENWFQKIFDSSKDLYERSLSWSLDHHRTVLLGSLVILLLTVLLFMWVPKGFIPSQDTGNIFGSTLVQEGTPFPVFAKSQQQMADIIRKSPDVSAIVSTVGQAQGGNNSTNAGQMLLTLKPSSQRHRSADEVIEDLRSRLRSLVGIKVFLQNPPSVRIGGIASSGNYQYILQGTNWGRLEKVSQQLFHAFSQIPGITDLDTDLKYRNPEIRLHILRDQAALLGVTPQQIESALYSAFGTRQLTTIYTPINQYQVIIEVDPQQQKQLADLYKIYIKSSTGLMVPLSSVVSATNGAGPLSVSHYGQLPAVTLSFNTVAGASIGDITNEINTIVKKYLPDDVFGQFTGTAKSFQESLVKLPILLLFTVLIIYMILGILYEHFIHPLTILTALPFAGFGAVLALILFNLELDIFSFIGIIMLVGIVKKNGIIMIDFALTLERTEGLSSKEAIFKACIIRYRPIMMTTLAAIVATLPIALGIGAGAESRRALGIAVVGGLLFSQLLTLYVTPLFYVVMDRYTRKHHKSKSAPTKT